LNKIQKIEGRESANYANSSMYRLSFFVDLKNLMWIYEQITYYASILNKIIKIYIKEILNH